MRRRTPAIRDTRAALLASAAEEFARLGIHGARVQSIVERAGVNERMLYHYFESKEGLYRAVLDVQWAAIASAWHPTLVDAAACAPRAGLARAFGAFAQVLRTHPTFLRLLMHEAVGGWKFAPRASIERVPNQIRALHERGRHGRTFRDDVDFEVFYLTMIGALTSHLLLAPRFARTAARRKPAAEHTRHLAAQTVQLVLDGISRRPSASRTNEKNRT